MPILAIANPKGGVGKSTLATNVAGYWASRGHDVLLGDVDAQQSARLWLDLRPDGARPIGHWAVQRDFIVRPSRSASHVVLDTPAALGGLRLRDVVRFADALLIPLQPGVFDLAAARAFIGELAELTKRSEVRLGLVGVRVRAHTLAEAELGAFAADTGLPLVTSLRPTQNYVRLAAAGLTVFDAAPSRVRRDLEQWHGLSQWLDALDRVDGGAA